MTGMLYTLGCAAPDALMQLERWMSNPDTFLVDVRLRPRSRWYPQWNKKALRTRFPHRYTHEHRLGHRMYQDPTHPIELVGADAEKSIEGAVDFLQGGYSLVLLCVCADYETCHRKVLAEMIHTRLVERTCRCGGPLTLDPFGEPCEVKGTMVCYECYCVHCWFDGRYDEAQVGSYDDGNEDGNGV